MNQKRCKHEFRLKVELYLDIPVELDHALSKAALRDSRVRIEGAGWPTALCYCAKCGWAP